MSFHQQSVHDLHRRMSRMDSSGMLEAKKAGDTEEDEFAYKRMNFRKGAQAGKHAKFSNAFATATNGGDGGAAGAAGGVSPTLPSKSVSPAPSRGRSNSIVSGALGGVDMSLFATNASTRSMRSMGGSRIDEVEGEGESNDDDASEREDPSNDDDDGGGGGDDDGKDDSFKPSKAKLAMRSSFKRKGSRGGDSLVKRDSFVSEGCLVDDDDGSEIDSDDNELMEATEMDNLDDVALGNGAKELRALIAEQPTNEHLLTPLDGAASCALPAASVGYTVDFDSQIGNRDEMEDTCAVCDDIGKGWETAWFGVYDGHSGGRASEMAAELLHKEAAKEIPPLPGSDVEAVLAALRKAMCEGHARLDEQFVQRAQRGRAQAETVLRDVLQMELEKKEWLCGSTSVAMALRGGVASIGFAGDSLAVLSRGGVAVELTRAHKPHREDEFERIRGAGGWVSGSVEKGGRVNGILAVSRAIGDIEYKVLKEAAWGMQFSADLVIAEPEVVPLVLRRDDEFVLLGSDGLWDGVLYQEAVDAVHAWRKEHGTIEGVAQSLVQMSIDRNILDNVTCVVVAFEYKD